MTWAQSIANEKLSIFAEATRVPKAHWETLWCVLDSLLLAQSASKVWVGSMGDADGEARREAEAAPGWAGLVEYLTIAGLEPGPLERMLTVLANAEVTDVHLLRRCFSKLAPQLRIGTRTLIGNALAATPPVGGPQQSRAKHPPAPLPAVAFNVLVSFKMQEATVRLALSGEDYVAKPVKGVLPQLDVLASQHCSGAYKIAGLSFRGARLVVDKSLREQGVPPASEL